jgi:hypothetical protein
MARSIIVKFNGQDSKFNFKKISRSVLYGKKKRIFLDEQKKECTTAKIDTKYGVLIHSGDASSVYIDDQNNYINKEEISGMDEDGKIVERYLSTLDISQELKKINEQYVLDFNCSSLYQLKEETLEKDLDDSLKNGDFYKFDFNYYSDFNVETGILMKNELGYFALIGKEIEIPWIDKGENIGECFETPELEEIDFEML